MLANSNLLLTVLEDYLEVYLRHEDRQPAIPTFRSWNSAP